RRVTPSESALLQLQTPPITPNAGPTGQTGSVDPRTILKLPELRLSDSVEEPVAPRREQATVQRLNPAPTSKARNETDTVELNEVVEEGASEERPLEWVAPVEILQSMIDERADEILRRVSPASPAKNSDPGGGHDVKRSAAPASAEQQNKFKK